MDSTTLVPNSTQMLPDDEFSLSANDIVSVVIYVMNGLFGIVGNTLVMIIFGLLTRQKSQVNMFIFNQALIDCCASVLVIIFGIMTVYRSKIMAYTPGAVVNSTESNDTITTVAIHVLESSGHFTYISRSMAEFLCRFWWSRTVLFSCFAISTYNLTVMSIERYFAVFYPTTYSRNFSKKRVLIMILLVWLISPIMETCRVIFMHTCGLRECTTQESWTFTSGAVLGIFDFIWKCLMPICILGYIYYNIIREMKKKKQVLQAKKPLDPSSVTATSTRNAENKRTSKHPSRNITNTLCILFVVYVICWTPNQVTFLQFNLGGPLNFTGVWYHITVTMAFLNSCINPFIYALRLEKFKKGMRMLLRCIVREPTDYESPRPQVSSEDLISTTPL